MMSKRANGEKEGDASCLSSAQSHVADFISQYKYNLAYLLLLKVNGDMLSGFNFLRMNL
jgi:hypothetical protein